MANAGSRRKSIREVKVAEVASRSLHLATAHNAHQPKINLCSFKLLREQR